MSNETEVETAKKGGSAVFSIIHGLVTSSLFVTVVIFVFNASAWKTNIERDLRDAERERTTNARLIAKFEPTIGQLADSTRELAKLQQAVVDITRGPKPWNSPSAWRRFSMVRWSEDLRHLNPSVNVPDANKTEYLDTDTGVVVQP